MTQNLTDEYIWTEILKLKYPYGLNSVIRYNLERNERFQTQSVAEHVTNMLFLAYYFRDLEDPNSELDFGKVTELIMLHDMGEIETGDVVAVAKKENHEILERQALAFVKEKSTSFIGSKIETLFEEISNPETKEGKYAKAIDKLEGQIFWVEKEGVEMVIHAHRTVGLETSIVHPIHMAKIFKMVDAYNFPVIRRFLEVIEKKKYSYGLL